MQLLCKTRKRFEETRKDLITFLVASIKLNVKLSPQQNANKIKIKAHQFDASSWVCNSLGQKSLFQARSVKYA